MKADVIMVGAGPAGCSAAYHAARAGLEVLLLDQHESRQDRADGDALFPRAVAEVSLMGHADWHEGPNHYKYEGVVVHARTARVRGPNSPANRHGVRGYVIPWFETTTRLLERARREAGASFRDGVRARTLLRSPSGAVSGVEVGEYGSGGTATRDETVRHEAPLVIVADGAGDFAGDEGTKAPSNGVTRRQYFTGVDGLEKDHLHVLQSDALNGIGYVYYLGDGRAAVGGSVWGLHPGDTHKGGEAFSKIKGIVRRAETRTREALVEALRMAISAVTARDAHGFPSTADMSRQLNCYDQRCRSLERFNHSLSPSYERKTYTIPSIIITLP